MGSVADFRAAASALFSRYQWGRQMGLTFGGKRDVPGVLGYKDYGTITVQDYIERYERGGVAGRVIDVLPNATWRGEVYLEEDEDPDNVTPFEKAWEDLEKRLDIRAKLNRVDKLSRLSTYAVLLIGAPGELDTELPKGKPESLLYLTPFLGGGGPAGQAKSGGTFDADATIYEFDVDMKSPRFGLPLSYNLRRTDIAMPSHPRPAHWTRILHVAEGTLRDDVYGQPALERVWNDFDNLDKVKGGGAESFWLRANKGLHLNVDKDMMIKPGDGQTELEKLRDQAEDYQHQLTRMIRTRGVEINDLGSDVANFSQPVDSIITLIAGATGIPKRLLVGSEMGELASTQDRENFRDLVNGRQMNYAGPQILRQLANRLIDYGYLPKPKEYKVKWPNIEVLGEKEKTEGAKAWATVNQAQGEVVYTSDEIRDHWSGMKPLTDEQKRVEEEKAAKKTADAQAAMETEAKIKGTVNGKPVAKPAEKGKKPAPFKPRAAQDKPREFSSTQVQLPGVLARKLLAYGRSIPDEDLAEDGREDDPHVTVKYGLHTAEAGDVRTALSDAVGPVTMTMGKTAVFEGDDYDVLYVTVSSPALKKLNAKISSSLETTDTHPTYIPHACVAYLKSGLGEKYAGDNRFDGLTADASTIVFSDQESNKTVIPLALRAASSSDDELVRVLEQALEVGADEVVAAIVGLEMRGLKGTESSGNHGHAGRPGERGGSATRGFTKATSAQRKALGLPPAWKNVRVNPNPKGALLAVGQDEAGRWQSRYSPEHTATKSAEKHGRVSAFGKSLPDLRGQIDKDHDSSEEAVVLDLIDKTSFRPGSKRNTKAKVQAYGASTLEGRHVKVTGDRVDFEFVAKEGTVVKQSLTDARLAKTIKARAKTAGPNGKLFNTNEKKVGDYMKEQAPGFTPKDFRTWNATKVALGIVKGQKPPKTKAEFKQMRKAVGAAVGKTLGHTEKGGGGIALKSYIAPAVFAKWEAGLV